MNISRKFSLTISNKNFKLFPQSFKRFTEVIKIDYNKLDSSQNILDEIHNSFGRNSLGLIIIKNIPGYTEAREAFLQKGYLLSQENEEYLKTLEKPEADYNVGWSKGRCFVDGGFDYMQGSFYARLLNDHLIDESDPQMEKNYTNIWPYKPIGFKESFLNLGKIMLDTQFKLLKQIDKYIESKKKEVNSEGSYLSLYDCVKEKNDIIGRLLTYFPVDSFDHKQFKGESDNWCGWHRDFGICTALCHPIYFDKKGIKREYIKSGLLVRDRNGVINDVNYGEDEIAIQSADVSFILSGGLIVSTPHAVKITEGIPKDVTRVTFVNFLEPSFSYKIRVPSGMDAKEVFAKDPFKMKDTVTNYKDNCTYKEFIMEVLGNSYY